MLSVSVPDVDDTPQARQLLADFGTLWLEIPVNRKNKLLRQMLDAIYVNLDTREVVALQPRETFSVQVINMAKNAGVTVLEYSRTSLT